MRGQSSSFELEDLDELFPSQQHRERATNLRNPRWQDGGATSDSVAGDFELLHVVRSGVEFEGDGKTRVGACPERVVIGLQVKDLVIAVGQVTKVQDVARSEIKPAELEGERALPLRRVVERWRVRGCDLIWHTTIAPLDDGLCAGPDRPRGVCATASVG